MTVHRLLAPALAACCLALASAAPARAGEVRVGDRVLSYTAAPEEFNELSIVLEGGRFTVQDGATGDRETLPVTAVAPCEPVEEDESLVDAVCPAEADRIEIDLGDGVDFAGIGTGPDTPFPSLVEAGPGADRVSGGPAGDELRGGDGDDNLAGNGGRDVLLGGAGDDTIVATDGFPDRVDCGEGFDVVEADPGDELEGCEVGGPEQPPGDPPMDPPPEEPVFDQPPADDPGFVPTDDGSGAGGATAGLLVDVISRWPTVARLARRGVVARVLCPAGCYLTAELRLRSPSAPRDLRVIAAGRKDQPLGGLTAVRARLRPGAARRLRRLRRPHLSLRVAVTDVTGTTVIWRRVRLS